MKSFLEGEKRLPSGDFHQLLPLETQLLVLVQLQLKKVFLVENLERLVETKLGFLWDELKLKVQLEAQAQGQAEEKQLMLKKLKQLNLEAYLLVLDPDLVDSRDRHWIRGGSEG